MTFQRARRTRTMRLTVPVGPESGFQPRAVGRHPISKSGIAFYVHERDVYIE
jgi:hypothetical protein